MINKMLINTIKKVLKGFNLDLIDVLFKSNEDHTTRIESLEKDSHPPVFTGEDRAAIHKRLDKLERDAKKSK